MWEVIGFADKLLQVGKPEVDSQFLHHERGLALNAVRFKADVCLSRIHDAIVAARAAVGDEKLDPSPVATLYWFCLLLMTKRVTGTSGTFRQVCL